MKHNHASKLQKHMTRLPKNFAKALRIVSGRDFSHIRLPGYEYTKKDKDGNVIVHEWRPMEQDKMMEFSKATAYAQKEGEAK